MINEWIISKCHKKADQILLDFKYDMIQILLLMVELMKFTESLSIETYIKSFKDPDTEKYINIIMATIDVIF